MDNQIFDVIIIGGGVAGMSAALWCDELGLDSILLESDAELGGQLLWTYNSIENHLGIKAQNGQELRDIVVKQIEERKFTRHFNAKVKEINLDKKFVLLEDQKSFSARALIIATGVRRRVLGIEGEKRFIGKGIIKSGKRDKHLVKGKSVLIIGGGDAAIENCLILSETASKIYVAHRSSKLRARNEFTQKAKQIEKVEFLKETILKKIKGDQKVSSVELEDLNKNETYTMPIDAVLFRIGVQPNTDFLEGKIELDERGYIKINDLCETSLNRIFAIGDVANPISPTVSSAVGMGATSVKTIYSQLK